MVLVKFSAHSFGYYTYIPRELLLVCLLILLHKVCHVICDVLSEDVLSVDVGVELAVVTVLLVESGESLGGVGDVDATVNGALHGTEHLGAGGGPGQADVEAGMEGGPLVAVLDQKVVAINLGLSGVQLVQLVLGQHLGASMKRLVSVHTLVNCNEAQRYSQKKH